MNTLTQQGIEAYKAGDPVAARYYLRQSLQQDRFDTQAWLWLSAAVEDNDDKAFCLRTVLRMDPGNETALRGMARLESGQAPDELPEEPPEEKPAERAAQPGPETGSYVPPFIFSEEELAEFEPFLNAAETGTAYETGLEKYEAIPEPKSEELPETEPVAMPEQDLRDAFAEHLSPLPEISIEEEQPGPAHRSMKSKPAAKSSFRPWMWAVLGILLLLIILVALAFVMLALR